MARRYCHACRGRCCHSARAPGPLETAAGHSCTRRPPPPLPHEPPIYVFLSKSSVTLPALPSQYDGTTLLSCVLKPILRWCPCAGAAANGRWAPLHEVPPPSPSHRSSLPSFRASSLCASPHRPDALCKATGTLCTATDARAGGRGSRRASSSSTLLRSKTARLGAARPGAGSRGGDVEAATRHPRLRGPVRRGLIGPARGARPSDFAANRSEK